MEGWAWENNRNNNGNFLFCSEPRKSEVKQLEGSNLHPQTTSDVLFFIVPLLFFLFLGLFRGEVRR